MKLLLVLLSVSLLSACVLTKVVTVPMRVAGAVASVVPIVGNVIDESIEEVADGIDEIPL
jgi:hypothetical protein